MAPNTPIICLGPPCTVQLVQETKIKRQKNWKFTWKSNFLIHKWSVREKWKGGGCYRLNSNWIRKHRELESRDTCRPNNRCLKFIVNEPNKTIYKCIELNSMIIGFNIWMIDFKFNWNSYAWVKKCKLCKFVWTLPYSVWVVC